MSDPIDFAILPESYEALSAEDVLSIKQLLRDLWKSAEPQLDIDHGALDSLVVTPAATLLEVGRTAYRTARRSSSLAALLADPSELAVEMLDELANSYRVQRRQGTCASGRLRLFFQEDIYRVIGLSTLFQANGVVFGIDHLETLQLSGEIPSTLPHYQNLRRTGDGSGLFYADITVHARSNGVSGNLVRGTEAALYRSGLPYFVRAVALETFTGGENDEDSESLVRRMLLGVSAKVLSSRVNMRAALLERFPEIRDSSVIGAGDPEMTRDKHTVFPGSGGGYADWYVGTTRQLCHTSLVLDSFRELDISADGSRSYLVTVDDFQISCLYYVTEIQDEQTLAPLEIVSQIRSVRDTVDSQTANAPLIHDEVEGAFSIYHVTEIRFVSRRPVERIRLYGIHAPNLRDIQDWVLHSGLAPIGLDTLVKGAIPTIVRFGAVLNTPAGEQIDEISLKSVIADFVNKIPFNGLLAVSELTSLLHQNLPSGSYITRPTLFATTYLPSGEVVITQSADRLEIDFPPFASNRTTMFYCDPADVSFELRYNERGRICE